MTVFLKPAPGRTVRDPVTKFPLPAEGREVQPSSYWLRRVASGDAMLAEAPAPEESTLEDSYRSDSDEVIP